jgi:glycosyltransferase involved in cell wall biosynthesis
VSAGRIRVLLLMTSTAGGVGLQNYFLARGLPRERFAVSVAFGPGYPFDGAFEALDVPVRRLSLSRRPSPLANLRGFIEVLRLLRGGGFDVVCTSASIAGLVGRVAGRMMGVPVRLHVLHVYASRPYQSEWKRRLYRGIERWLDGFTTAYVAVSESAKRFGVDSGIMTADKVAVIFNAVERRAPGARPSLEIRRELGLRPDSRVVGTLGRLETQKGIRYLLSAVPAVLERHPDTEFVVVGDGPLRGELEALSRRLGVDGVVRFAGWREDVPEILGILDVFCLASLWETFGLVLAEAMFVSLPVVATRVDAIPEVVADNETGLLVPPRDPAALAAGISKLLADPALARTMGLAGFERASSMFSLDAMLGGYERLLDSLALNRDRRGSPAGRAEEAEG